MKEELGESLRVPGAAYVVGGSVRRFQESVRITVQLVDVVTNRQLWGNTYKGKLDDTFDIQEQVAQQIVEALSGIALSQLIRPGTPVIFGSFQVVIEPSKMPATVAMLRFRPAAWLSEAATKPASRA